MNEEIKKYIDEQIRNHSHNGTQASRTDLGDIFGMFRTITDATDLANTIAAAPSNVFQQIFIDTSTATKRLYIYDGSGRTWLKVTIA